MSDEEAIYKFLSSISWWNRCQVKDGVVYSPIEIMLPCHWKRLPKVIARVIRLAELNQRSPGLILHGEDAHYGVVESSFWLCGRARVSVHWVGASQQVMYSKLLCSSFNAMGFDLSALHDFEREIGRE